MNNINIMVQLNLELQSHKCHGIDEEFQLEFNSWFLQRGKPGEPRDETNNQLYSYIILSLGIETCVALLRGEYSHCHITCALLVLLTYVI